MYNNPYYYNYYPYSRPYFNNKRPSLGDMFSKIKWGTILNNTQKTLNVINQAIPVYYQIKPIASNLRSFGKIMSAFNSPDTNKTQAPTTIENPETKKENPNGLPTFFID